MAISSKWVQAASGVHLGDPRRAEWIHVAQCSACGKDHRIRFFVTLAPLFIDGARVDMVGWCDAAGRVVYHLREVK